MFTELQYWTIPLCRRCLLWKVSSIWVARYNRPYLFTTQRDLRSYGCIYNDNREHIVDLTEIIKIPLYRFALNLR